MNRVGFSSVPLSVTRCPFVNVASMPAACPLDVVTSFTLELVIVSEPSSFIRITGPSIVTGGCPLDGPIMSDWRIKVPPAAWKSDLSRCAEEESSKLKNWKVAMGFVFFTSSPEEERVRVLM